MSVNRLSDGYRPDFDIDAAVGRQGEMFVRDTLQSMASGIGEVKTQPSVVKYGNFYLEYACLKRGDYVPSGIEATQAEYFACAFPDPPSVFVAAPTALWRAVHERALRDGRVRETIRGSHPTRGTIVSLRDVLTHLLDAQLAVEAKAA